MATQRTNGPQAKRTRRPTATTPEAREKQLASLAYDVAEEQMRSGEASSQIISHFLKVGSTSEKLNQDLVAQRIALEKVKMEVLASERRTEELMKEAINAFREYSGNPVVEEEDYG